MITTTTSLKVPYPNPFQPVLSPSCHTYVHQGSQSVGMEGDAAEYLPFSWCMKRPPRAYRTCLVQITRSGSIMSVGHYSLYSYKSKYKVTGGRNSTYDVKYSSQKAPSCVNVMRGDELEWYTTSYIDGKPTNDICFSTKRCPTINTTIPTTHLPKARNEENICDWFCHSWVAIPILVFICAMLIPWYVERRAKRRKRLARIPINTTNSSSHNDNVTTISDVPPEEVKPVTASMPTADAVPIAVAEHTTAEELSRGTTPLVTAVSVTKTDVLL